LVCVTLEGDDRTLAGPAKPSEDSSTTFRSNPTAPFAHQPEGKPGGKLRLAHENKRPSETDDLLDSFSEDEAEHLVIRADLLIQIQKVVTARRLKQAPLAKVLQVSQPRVSDLLRGRLHLFSIETLIDMLGRLGVQVRLVVKPTRRRPVA
jgi:predicted XRE-type DNA-binding protein